MAILGPWVHKEGKVSYSTSSRVCVSALKAKGSGPARGDVNNRYRGHLQLRAEEGECCLGRELPMGLAHTISASGCRFLI